MNQKRHIHVVAAAVCDNGEWLCMKKGKTTHDYTSFHWEFPGGKVEPGETEEEALHRELREEMDYEVVVESLLSRADYTYADFNLTLAVYRCTPADRLHPRRFIRKEHIDHCWLPVDEISRLDWMPADKKIVELIAESGIAEGEDTIVEVDNVTKG